jgi:hypothetical protein
MDKSLFVNKYAINLNASDEAIMKSYNDQNKNKVKILKNKSNI